MNWACERCGTLHTQNPNECRNCGETTFAPVRDEELPDTGGQGPEAVETDHAQTYGTTPEPDFDSGPDVAVDGSVDASEQPQESPSVQKGSQFGNWLRRIRWKLRATLRAPIGLLREMALPILAFVLVVVAVWWLFS